MTRISRDILEMVDRYRAMLARVNGNAAKVLAPEARALERKIAEAIARRDGKLERGEIEALRREMRVAVRASSQKAGKLLSEFVAPGVRIARAKTEETTALLLRAVRHPRTAETLQIMREYTRKSAQRSLVSTPFYERRFAKSWDDRWSKVVTDIGRDFERVALNRGSWEDAVERLAPRLESLQEFGRIVTPTGRVFQGPRPISGYMHPTAFARGFARTEMGNVYRRESIEEAQAIGLESFVNIGVPDERQSIICSEASNAGALSMDEWRAWRRDPNPSYDGGPPPRHVFNCRCDLIGVPAIAKNWDWSQPNPVADTYDDIYAGDFERKELVAA